jgi:hypothetical protein
VIQAGLDVSDEPAEARPITTGTVNHAAFAERALAHAPDALTTDRPHELAAELAERRLQAAGSALLERADDPRVTRDLGASAILGSRAHDSAARETGNWPGRVRAHAPRIVVMVLPPRSSAPAGRSNSADGSAPRTWSSPMSCFG